MGLKINEEETKMIRFEKQFTKGKVQLEKYVFVDFVWINLNIWE